MRHLAYSTYFFFARVCDLSIIIIFSRLFILKQLRVLFNKARLFSFFKAFLWCVESDSLLGLFKALSLFHLAYSKLLSSLLTFPLWFLFFCGMEAHKLIWFANITNWCKFIKKIYRLKIFKMILNNQTLLNSRGTNKNYSKIVSWHSKLYHHSYYVFCLFWLGLF